VPETVEELMASSTNALPALLSRRVQAAPEVDGSEAQDSPSTKGTNSTTTAALNSRANGERQASVGAGAGSGGTSTKKSTISRANLGFMPSVLRSSPAPPSVRQTTYGNAPQVIPRTKTGHVTQAGSSGGSSGSGKNKGVAKHPSDGVEEDNDADFDAFMRDVEQDK
jgi:hypothetical protein